MSRILLFALLLCSLAPASAFVSPQAHRRHEIVLHLKSSDRRSLLRQAALIAVGTSILPVAFTANAEEEDLTTKLFNEDGSLKDESTEIEAKFRKVELMWDGSNNQLAIAVDGENSAATPKGSSLRLSYDLPEKWNTESKKYIDKAEGVKVCDRITVYRAEGSATTKLLEKASIKGIGESLRVTEDLKDIKKTDLIGGRSRIKGDQKYFDFDLANAPSTCSASKEDLGLGFCPYESIYLLSSTVFDNCLYVFALECDKAEWKLANSDLRRVRSSFSVEYVS